MTAETNDVVSESEGLKMHAKGREVYGTACRIIGKGLAMQSKADRFSRDATGLKCRAKELRTQRHHLDDWDAAKAKGDKLWAAGCTAARKSTEMFAKGKDRLTKGEAMKAQGAELMERANAMLQVVYEEQTAEMAKSD